MATVETWDFLRVVQLIATVLMPLALLWFGLVANDRRERNRAQLVDIERQIQDLRLEVREARMEMREGRKECSDDVRAIAAQISEYPRRREIQEAVGLIYQEIRGNRGGR